jgi:hypothetical protein
VELPKDCRVRALPTFGGTSGVFLDKAKLPIGSDRRLVECVDIQLDPLEGRVGNNRPHGLLQERHCQSPADGADRNGDADARRRGGAADAELTMLHMRRYDSTMRTEWSRAKIGSPPEDALP